MPIIIDPSSGGGTIQNYAGLQAKIISQSHRTGDTDFATEVPDFISLCEAHMQAECKLLEFEASSTVTITNGTGTLPTGYLGLRSVYWDGSPDYPLTYVTPEKYDAMRGNDSGDGSYYTIVGSSIRTTPMGSGSLVVTGLARFTPLSNSNTTNALLTSFPDAYLFGSLYQCALWRDDDDAAKKYLALFESAIPRINKNNDDRRFGGQLTVRAR